MTTDLPATDTTFDDTDSAKVFVSYSRKDREKAQKISDVLRQRHFGVFRDTDDILPTEEWRERLEQLIAEADTIVFLLSPASATSEVCAWEVDYATKLGKRIAPIVIEDVDASLIPPLLARLNFIFATDRDPFENAVSSLVSALNTDIEWIREHTRLASIASRWDRSDRPTRLLLRGQDVTDAESWRDGHPPEAPQPTPMHLAFIAASRRAVGRRLRAWIGGSLVAAAGAVALAVVAYLQSVEADQQRAQAETARGIAEEARTEAEDRRRDAETARAEAEDRRQEAEAARALADQRRQEAEDAQAEAEAQRQQAEQARTEAENARDATLRTQSRFLADLAQQEMDSGDYLKGLALALEGAPKPPEFSDRPRVPEVDAALDRGLRERDVQAVMGGHQKWINCGAFSPDGSIFVTVDQEGVAGVWNAWTGNYVTSLNNHNDELNCPAFSSDARSLITPGNDGRATIWDTSNGQPKLVLEGHRGPILSAVFSDDGTRVLTGAQDGLAVVWDASTGEPLQVIRGHEAYEVWVNHAIYSPDERLILTSSTDQTTRIWNSATGIEIARLGDQPGTVRKSLFTPDASKVATAAYGARIWDATTGALLHTLGDEEHFINDIAISPDGTLLATASEDTTVRLWEIATGEQRFAMTDHAGKVTAVAFSPDGTLLLSAGTDDTARLWEVATGNAVKALKGHDSYISFAGFSPDGTRIATTSWDRTARLYSVDVPAQSVELTGHTDLVSTAEYALAGTRIITTSYDGSARIYDTSNGTTKAELGGHDGIVTAARLSADGTLAITGSTDKTVRIWDAATGTLTQTLTPGFAIKDALLPPDGTRAVLVPSQSKSAWLWGLESATETAELGGHTESIRTAAMSPDGRTIATGSRTGLRIWDGVTGKLHWATDNNVKLAVFSPDGTRLATGAGNGSIRVLDVESGAILFSHDSSENSIRHLAFAPEGARLLSTNDSLRAYEEKVARIWDIQTGKLITRIGTRDHGVHKANFSPDGTRVVTASTESSIGIWDAETGTEIARLRGPETEGIQSAAYAPNGAFLLVVPRESQSFRLFPAWPYETALNSARQLVDTFGPLTKAERCRYFIADVTECR